MVDIACSSDGDEELFWKIFDERLELCYRALMIRHNRLSGTPSDVAPILWQYGALSRLEKGEKIDKLLHGGYSTLSLGYAGLYECTYRMKGVSHTEPEIGKPFALKVMQKLNDACAEWKAKDNIDFSIYGTPLESVTYKFAKCLKDRFGVTLPSLEKPEESHEEKVEKPEESHEEKVEKQAVAYTEAQP